MKHLAKGAAAVALVALLGLAVTSNAVAAGEQFHSEVEPTVLTADNGGEGSHVFEVEDKGPKVTCTTATFAGTVPKKAVATITVHPTYSGCQAESGAATIVTTGCNFVVHAEELLNAQGELHGDTELECAGENQIQVKAPGCTIFIGPQKSGDGSAYANNGAGATRSITVKMTDTFTFTKKEGALCFAVKGDSLIYHGSFVANGFEDKGGPNKEDEYTEGNQVGIWWE